MADVTAAERLQKFLATGPQRSDFTRSRTEGRGKAAKVVQDVDEPSFQAAQQKFLSDNADVINSMKQAVSIETQDAAHELGKKTGLTQYLASPEGVQQQNWNAGMAIGPLLPSAVLSSYLSGYAKPGTSISGRVSKLGYGAAEVAAGEALRRLLAQQQPGQEENPAVYYGNQGWQNFALSSGIGGGLGTARSALANIGTPQPQSPAAPPALPPAAAAPEPPAPAPLPPPPQPNLEKGMRYGDATKEIARFLGQPVSGAKADVTGRSVKALGDASDDQIRGLASSLNDRGFSVDTTAEIGALRKAVRGAIQQVAKNKGTLASLAGLGLGAYEALSPDESQAGGLPTAGPAQGESLTQYRLRSLGLPSTPEEAGQTALDLTPFIGEARMGTALGQTGRGIMGALNPPTSVMGDLGDPRLARYRNWVEDQRKMGNDPHQQAMADLADHMDMMHRQYGQRAGAPGAGMPPGGGMPTGGGMAGLTGVPGAGGGLPAQPAALPPQTGMGGMGSQRQPSMSTADILAAMSAGRERGALLAMLAGGAMQ